MFGLIRFFIGLIFTLGFGYFVFFVSLGEKTFYQHILSICQTQEAAQLGEGIKQKALNFNSGISKNESDSDSQLLNSDKANVTPQKDEQDKSLKQKKPESEKNLAQNSDLLDEKISSDDKNQLEKLLKNKFGSN